MPSFTKCLPCKRYGRACPSEHLYKKTPMCQAHWVQNLEWELKRNKIEDRKIIKKYKPVKCSTE